MRDKPLVSVITVCYNSANTIEVTINSMLAQTYCNYEHIFIDGGSTDDTIKIIKSFKNQYQGRMHLYTGKDKGIYDAMNKGISYATGKIIGIINSDDWYSNNALEIVVNIYIESNVKNVIITGDLIRTDINRNDLFCQTHNNISILGLKQGMPLQHPAVFVASEVYNNIGIFDISFKYLADYDFIWRCFDSRKVEFYFTHTVTSYMREGGASDTLKFKHIWRRTKERYLLRKKYMSKIESIYLASKFIIVEITKQTVKRILPTSIKAKYYKWRHAERNDKNTSY